MLRKKAEQKKNTKIEKWGLAGRDRMRLKASGSCTGVQSVTPWDVKHLKPGENTTGLWVWSSTHVRSIPLAWGDPGWSIPLGWGDTPFPCLKIFPLGLSCLSQPSLGILVPGDPRPWRYCCCTWEASTSKPQAITDRVKNPLPESKRTSVQCQLLWGQRGEIKRHCQVLSGHEFQFCKKSFTNPNGLVVAAGPFHRPNTPLWKRSGV